MSVVKSVHIANIGNIRKRRYWSNSWHRHDFLNHAVIFDFRIDFLTKFPYLFFDKRKPFREPQRLIFFVAFEQRKNFFPVLWNAHIFAFELSEARVFEDCVKAIYFFCPQRFQRAIFAQKFSPCPFLVCWRRDYRHFIFFMTSQKLCKFQRIFLVCFPRAHEYDCEPSRI